MMGTTKVYEVDKASLWIAFLVYPQAQLFCLKINACDSQDNAVGVLIVAVDVQ